MIGHITDNKEATKGTMKKAEFDFMMDLKSLIAKSEQDAEINRVRASMRSDDKLSPSENFRQVFDRLSKKWGLLFLDRRNVIPEIFPRSNPIISEVHLPEKPDNMGT